MSQHQRDCSTQARCFFASRTAGKTYPSPMFFAVIAMDSRTGRSVGDKSNTGRRNASCHESDGSVVHSRVSGAEPHSPGGAVSHAPCVRSFMLSNLAAAGSALPQAEGQPCHRRKSLLEPYASQVMSQNELELDARPASHQCWNTTQKAILPAARPDSWMPALKFEHQLEKFA
jgi:hypothetical protein